MTASELLRELTASGCELSVVGGFLEVRDPQRALYDSRRALIREHKLDLIKLLPQGAANEVVELLPYSTTLPCPQCGDTTRWRTIGDVTGEPGTVCTSCFVERITPEVPDYITRCPQCGGTNWGFTGDYEPDIGWEIWTCMTCWNNLDES